MQVLLVIPSYIGHLVGSARAWAQREYIEINSKSDEESLCKLSPSERSQLHPAYLVSNLQEREPERFDVYALKVRTIF
jgi:hypothetical protein